MIKREFIENNLLKVLNYLPQEICKSNHIYYLSIWKTSENLWCITYETTDNYSLFYVQGFNDLIDGIIYIIKSIDTVIPDFANNLINI